MQKKKEQEVQENYNIVGSHIHTHISTYQNHPEGNKI